MTFSTLALVLLTCLVLGTDAFTVSFYKNTNCAGEFLGTWVGGEGQGCRHEYAGLAEGVVVESTGSVDGSTMAQFDSSDDSAPGTEISRANAGCITVDQSVVGSYKSFQVVPITAPASSSSLSARHSPNQRRYPFPLSPEPRATLPTPQIYHGMQVSFDGAEYKLHQIYANAYVGILPDEWDDSIHIRNDTNLAYYELFPGLMSREVDERDLAEALCNTFASCVSTAVFEFLQQPFFTQVAIDTVAGLVPEAVGGVVQAVVGAQVAGNTNNAAACSQQNDQIDALISIISSQISALSAASAKITAQKNDAGDEVFTVTVTVTACGTTLGSAACSATGGFCPS
ncbi:uncharacterized protein Z519_06380 [Cladophialophora bantiana CBS 173.52]|uniref:Uncharacterized protein n=1 Tax=Cladophialophora bantiana (strain ATCC 10958 / CBS 173.52 / CDC B-1940 / NIH 8579) TaxID=1442370 RepID=A0A0D2HH11_CLAB1|nr:uncharacterized protein Z519_06380 [Cladophialophora bantiana CBS 173.52]KIW92533.1 hypothetical protein Z519_06380 [Cladophialophora bantiana CBS 173.52]